jgi:release factor glutamine methyltransferase
VRRDPRIRLEVSPQVYAPAEDSFLLLSVIEVCEGEEVLDMGCGSGLLSLHMAKAGARVTAVDIDPVAVEDTEANARRNGIALDVIRSDLFAKVRGSFDLLVFNPPYLRGEVRGQEDLCWAGGELGTEVTGAFLEGARDHLRPGGRVLLLVSSDADGRSMRKALKGWSVREVASRTIFFEELKVLSLTL